jgi:hypothetical protein
VGETPSVESEQAPVGLPMAIVAHLVALFICALAVYSVFASETHALDSGDALHRDGVQGLPLLFALILAIPVLCTRGRLAAWPVGKVLGAAGLVYVFSLSADHVIANDFLPSFVRSLHLSWGGVVVIVGGLAWGVSVLAGMRLPYRHTGFEAAALLTVVGLALAIVCTGLAFTWEYAAEEHWSANIAELVRLGIYGLLFVAALYLSGARRIGSALHFYVAGALLAGLAVMYALHWSGAAPVAAVALR